MPTDVFLISVRMSRFQASDENFLNFRSRFSSDKGPLSTKTETKSIFVSVSAEIFVTIRISQISVHVLGHQRLY